MGTHRSLNDAVAIGFCIAMFGLVLLIQGRGGKHPFDRSALSSLFMAMAIDYPQQHGYVYPSTWRQGLTSFKRLDVDVVEDHYILNSRYAGQSLRQVDDEKASVTPFIVEKRRLSRGLVRVCFLDGQIADLALEDFEALDLTFEARRQWEDFLDQ